MRGHVSSEWRLVARSPVLTEAVATLAVLAMINESLRGRCLLLTDEEVAEVANRVIHRVDALSLYQLVASRTKSVVLENAIASELETATPASTP